MSKAQISFLEGQQKTINELKKIPVSLCLNRRIINENNFVGAVVSGKRQSGKSMYMLIALYELYQDWDEVFKHIFFGMKEFKEFLKESLDSGIRVPAVAIDDAGVHFGAQQWLVNTKKVVYITALLDTIGIITKSIIITVPKSNSLMKAIREADFYKIDIHPGRNKYDREAHGYSISTSPKEQIIVKKEFVDIYDVRVPNTVYERYAELRKEYSKYALENMDDAFNDGKEEKKIKEPKRTKKDEILEAKRDLEAGVHGDISFRQLCKAKGFDYQYARAIS